MPRSTALAIRVVQLFAGLTILGLALALIVEADLGLDPWNVFHQGVSERTGVGLGWVVIITGVVVLLGWVPLRQWPGFGTVANALVVGLAIEVALDALPTQSALGARIAFLAAGVLLNGLALGLYIGAGMGPGPRDGLMTGIAARGHSIRVVRTGIELTVLGAGFLLGGSVGVGTIVFALTTGPLVHLTLPWFDRWQVDQPLVAPGDTAAVPG